MPWLYAGNDLIMKEHQNAIESLSSDPFGARTAQRPSLGAVANATRVLGFSPPKKKQATACLSCDPFGARTAQRPSLGAVANATRVLGFSPQNKIRDRKSTRLNSSH